MKAKMFGKTSLLFALSCGTLLSCGNVSSSSSSVSSDPVKASVYSTRSTVKVVKNSTNDTYFEKGAPEISISLMKNESESSSLCFTPDKDVSSFRLVTSDLHNGFGTILPKESISVYVQKYSTLISKFNKSINVFNPGDEVPDFLLPMDKAIEYRINNVAKGQNQGITIDVKTNHDTQAGIYRGTFQLILDNVAIDIPVTVKVWDIELSGKSKLQSCFLIYRNYLLQGEMDTSDKMMKSYADMLLDYKVNSMYIRNEDMSTEGIKAYTDEAIEMFENENYNSINIPYMFHGYNYQTSGTMTNKIYQYVRNLVEASTPEKPYIDYAYFYGSAYDEADANPELYPQAVEFYQRGSSYDLFRQYCVSRLQSEGVVSKFSPEFREHVLNSVANIPNVFTNTKYYDALFEDSVATGCPLLSIFNSDINAQKMEKSRVTNSNDQLWTYTCSGPVNPHPTLHLDDFNLGTRVAGWMMKKNNITGYLYWAVNLYERVSRFGSLDVFVDPYTSPNRAGDCPGDGYLVYPGKYFGSDSPFPSLRLLNYRDSNDDYDMLGVYEKLLKEKAEEYGIEIKFSDYVDDLYDSLFKGTIYVNEDERVYAAREELARRILSLKNGDGLILKSNVNDLTRKIEAYSTNASMVINGSTIKGTPSNKGYAYSISLPANSKQTLSLEGVFPYSYTFEPSRKIVDYSSPEASYYLSKNSTADFKSSYVDVTMKSVYAGQEGVIDGATKRFTPTFGLYSNGGFAKVKSLDFPITNLGEKTMEVNVCLNNDSTSTNIGGAYLEPGETRNIHINLSTTASATLSSAKSLDFVFSNTFTDTDGVLKLCPNRLFRLGSIMMKEGE